MQRYPCRCLFVPPHVLDKLAAAGIEEARLSVQQSTAQRDQRAKVVPNMVGAAASMLGAAAPPMGTAKRRVYDCETTMQQRKTLARDEGAPKTADASVNQVYDSAGHVLEYFKTKLGRNSIDNRGLDLILNVHYGNKYMNAFWDGDEMSFGDGDGVRLVDFGKSLDVVAHELSHGVTQHTAALQYNSQSGALNEHFSDVFGSAITQSVNKQDAGKADWLIGDEIMAPELQGEALRSMKAPGSAYDNKLLQKDPQPAHMKDYYSGTDDNGGVHINSGIPNRVFYLVSMDIGTEEAALIWYTALQKLWATATFNDAAQVIAGAALDLSKAGKVRPGSAQSVRAAFKAVGLPQ